MIDFFFPILLGFTRIFWFLGNFIGILGDFIPFEGFFGLVNASLNSQFGQIGLKMEKAKMRIQTLASRMHTRVLNQLCYLAIYDIGGYNYIYTLFVPLN